MELPIGQLFMQFPCHSWAWYPLNPCSQVDTVFCKLATNTCLCHPGWAKLAAGWTSVFTRLFISVIQFLKQQGKKITPKYLHCIIFLNYWPNHMFWSSVICFHPLFIHFPSFLHPSPLFMWSSPDRLLPPSPPILYLFWIFSFWCSPPKD